MTITGPDDPRLDFRVDWTGSYAALKAQFPANTLPLGVLASTTDLGLVATAEVQGVVGWYGLCYANIP